MNPSSYLPIFLVLVVLLVILRRRKGLIAKKTVEKRRKGDKKEMVEIALLARSALFIPLTAPVSLTEL